MKNKGFVVALIVLFSIIIIGLGVALVFAINGNFKFNFNVKESTNLVLEEEYTKEFDEVIIDSEMSNVYIKNSDKIKLEIYGKNDKFTVTDDKSLNISIKDSCKTFCFNTEIFKVVLYVPESYSKKITIRNNYGDVKVDKLNNTLLDIDSNYGDIKIDTIKDIKINEDYGDISINEVTNYLKITSDYGDVNIKKVNIKEDSKINLDYGDVEIDNINDIYVDAKTDMGDVKIKNNNRKSDITLTIDNDMGDIKVK